VCIGYKEQLIRFWYVRVRVFIVALFEGDEGKLAAVRLLRGYIELLGPHIRVVLHSDVQLRRLSEALTHVLQFDCSLIQIIEERTAGMCSL